jgi:uncharacterized phiE125 gp8 family phage protein
MNRPFYSLVTAPETEPVIYDEAAEHLRVDSEADASYIDGLIAVAREYVDSITGRVSATSTWKLTCAGWHELLTRGSDIVRLERTPLVSVSHVKYYTDDVLTTLDSAEYRVITAAEPGMIQFHGETPSVDDRPDALQITFVAGYTAPEETPPGLRHAIKMLVAHLYENRLPVAFASCQEIPFTLQSLIANQKTGPRF